MKSETVFPMPFQAVTEQSTLMGFRMFPVTPQ